MNKKGLVWKLVIIGVVVLFLIGYFSYKRISDSQVELKAGDVVLNVDYDGGGHADTGKATDEGDVRIEEIPVDDSDPSILDLEPLNDTSENETGFQNLSQTINSTTNSN